MNEIEASLLWLTVSRLATTLFTVFIAWMTYRSNLLLKEIELDFNVLTSLPEVISRILFVGICLFFAWLSGLPASELGLTTTNFWRSIGLGFGIGVITQLVVNTVTILAITHFGKQIYSAWLIRNILPRRGIEWVWVALAFIPSVLMEELLFRSLLLGTFQTLVPIPILIIGTSLIFGFMHQPQGKLGMIVAGAINILFSVIFIWTGELLVPFAAHYTINVLQIMVASIVIRRFPQWI